MSLRLPLSPAVRRWTLPVLVAALICYWSIVAPPPSIVFATPPGADAITSATVASGLDLSWLDRRHGLAYASLALALRRALADRGTSPWRTGLLILGITVGYGTLLEIGQLFRPGRVASLADAASNAVGAGIALVLSGSE
ncbi:VanZ family protein [Natrinema salifodinae]|uniref:VanZ like family protein n=1 Tax=Natrinema salifodinae TaxID=1202768 RepID=A0A1I0M0B9_9EURY|nr:VanZ family protein [Natrinema salifodinae]SEV81789.1 hypothetical protein SAMN05216285_0264 [Natrinema salifodinae]